MAHCFSCGRSTQTLEQLLTDIGRQDLIITDTFDLDGDKKLMISLFWKTMTGK